MLHNLDPAWGDAGMADAVETVEKLKSELSEEGHPVVVAQVVDHALGEVLRPYSPDEFVIFNWCEELPGLPRSDNRVAEILEDLNFAYTGSSPQVLAFSWDKAATKALLIENGIPTPDGRLVAPEEVDGWDRFPAIVKPAMEHCSLGISTDAVVMDRHELRERVLFVRNKFNQPALVEDFIDGREFHVTLWGNGMIHALPAVEMDFGAFDNIRDRLCTFDSKFTPGSEHYENIEMRIPAPLDESQLAGLYRTAIRAYKAMGCRDYGRIDMRSGNGHYYVLDINPNADFSPDTSTVYAAEASGLSYGAMASWLVNLAALRHPLFSRRI